MNRACDTDKPALLSIGALARLSGVPVGTIRNWERRYGWPAPIRLNSGHRRYPSELVSHLRLARSGVDIGLKPSYVTAASRYELEAAVQTATDDPPEMTTNALCDENEIDEWLNQVQRLDSDGFEAALRKSWCKHDAEMFICEVAEPFWVQLREFVASNRMSRVHEHFANELLSTFLASQWRPFSTGVHACKVILTGFEGAQGTPQLHMAAVFFALHNMEVVFLGPNTPIEDIVITVVNAGATAMVIQIMPTSDILTSRYLLTNLRAAIPPATAILVSGCGDGPPAHGVLQVETMHDLLTMVRSLSDVHCNRKR